VDQVTVTKKEDKVSVDPTEVKKNFDDAAGNPELEKGQDQ